MSSTRVLAAVAVAAAGAVGVALAPGNPATPGDHSVGRITLAAQPVSPGQPGISDSLNGKPILSVSSAGMAVGKPVSGSVTITNTGNSSLTVALSQLNLTHGPASSPDLSAYANLTVTDNTRNKTVYGGPVSGFASSASPLTLCGKAATNNGNGNGGSGNGNGNGNKTANCPAWAGAESHTFTFSVVIPEEPAGSKVSVNAYQGAWLKTDYAWLATN
jgi:hypothetical protein